MKPVDEEDALDLIQVAPRAGAWIETKLMVTLNLGMESPPARGRGLKH